MLEGHLLPMLYVRDVPRSTAFYRDVLGFEFAGWWNEETRSFQAEPPPGPPPGFSELRAGDLVLHLHAASQSEPVPTGGAILHLVVKDADAYHAQLVARGARVEPPRDQPWGWRQLYVDDPDGHRWSFHHRL
jgi:uncharacterized glyoxalase superfamily protein PhnB